MSRPWMPLYVADYLKDTQRLSAAEHGAYLLLIMDYWSNGGLPTDRAQLARIARMTPQEWRRAEPTIERYFGEGWTHARIDKELQEAALSYERRANAGRVGGEAKARANPKAPKLPSNAGSIATSNASSNASALLKQSPSQSEEEASASSRAAAARNLSSEEIERDLEAATEWRLPGLHVIERLIEDGHSFPNRILPLAREVAASRRRLGQGAPENWAYLAAIVADPQRKVQAANKPSGVTLVTVDRDSPLWTRAAAAWKAEKGRSPPCPNGKWHFPPHMVEERATQ